MTGKEDLFDELEDVLRECSEYSFKCDYEIYNLDSAFNKLKKRLTKYKRALGIFERLLNDDFVYGGFEDGRLVIDGSIHITDEEKELLEELMKFD